MPALFRRREVWFPTAWGGLLLLAVAAGLVAVLARATYPFFAVHEPAISRDGSPARILVVEGWLSGAELKQVRAAVPPGRYERIVTSGHPISGWPPHATAAHRAAAWLKSAGFTETPIDPAPAAPSRTERTYSSAVAVRDWLQAQGLRPQAIDVYTAAMHARRTRMLYRLAFGPGVAVGVLATPPDDYDPERWWTASAGVKEALSETVGVVWTWCCFWPG